MQKLWRSRRELSLLIYSESVTNNSARNTGENMKWYSQLPNTISISQTHSKRNLRCKIDYKHKQVKATVQVMIGRIWNGSVSVTITCSSVKLVNFEFHCQDFVYKLWQPGNFAVFTFLCTNFFQCHGNICFLPVSHNWTFNAVPKFIPSRLDWSALMGALFILAQISPIEI